MSAFIPMAGSWSSRASMSATERAAAWTEALEAPGEPSGRAAREWEETGATAPWGAGSSR